MNDPAPIRPRALADVVRRPRRVFINDLVLVCHIGVHSHERRAGQRVRINADLAVHDDGRPLDDDLANVVCYETIVDGIKRIVAEGHINLVETLAERIADMCLADRRVERARIRIEKLDIYRDAASVGVEIERSQPIA